MILVPLITKNKQDFYKRTVAEGGEGIMLKDPRGIYTDSGRPKAMYKVKRFEEVDAFVTAGERGEEDKGWHMLIGALVFSAYTETGSLHEVAKCTGISFEERCNATVCAGCNTPVTVSHENQDGKRVVLDTRCIKCNIYSPTPTLNPQFLNRTAEIKGQEWSARCLRLSHATIEKWRDNNGPDGKRPEDCKIDLSLIKSRFESEE